jgi:predicted nucleic-acid-binding protein
VRFLVNDDVEQGQIARKFFATLSEENPGYICLVALAETCWVLAKVYKKSQDQIAQAILGLLDSGEVIIQSSIAVRGALLEYEQSVDFADALISALGIEADCQKTVTFDKHAATALNGMRMLK